ncbi:MAG: tetratricopeptide repeat protein, partial [Acidobacteriota bacterium]|nr:tetratricopeptide repeat protein [Acidobacteriota bacterium]
KKKIELDAEIERSITPETQTRRRRAATEEQTSHPTSSAEYIITEIKRHRRGLLIATMAIVLASVAGIIFYLNSARTSAGAGRAAIDSIAVLPLANVTNDPNLEYLSDGISESLINSLTELQQLRVIARSTAFRYKGRDADPQAVGRELNVRAVLTGRVRQVGDRLNIQVDLVDAQTGAQLWGQEYERKASDLLSVKQAIAREVTDRLRLRLSGEEQKQLAKLDTTNSESFQFYLKGRYYWNKRTADGLRKAIEQFQQAIDLDPNYALGYVGLADSYAVLEEYAGTPASETLPKARAAVDRALQIDDSLAEAHASSGLIYNGQWRWAEAQAEYKRAISLNPNYASAHQWYSQYFRIRRQFDETLREVKRAQELDPLSPIISMNVAAVDLLTNDLNSAINECNRIIELDPSFPRSYDLLGQIYLKQQRYGEATAEFQKAVELSGRSSESLSDLGYCYAVTGKRNDALQILKELEDKYAKRESVGLYLAGVHAGLGDRDSAFQWLEKDFVQRSGQLQRITWWFSFDDLRSDPRYADLLRRMGLTP